MQRRPGTPSHSRRSWPFSLLTILFLALPLLIPPHAARPVQAEPAGLAAPVRQEAPVIWSDFQGELALLPAEQAALPSHYRLLEADLAALQAALAAAPAERSGGAGAVLDLPLPDGTLARFQLESYAMMEPGLAARFPTFATYLGWGLDEPAAAVRVSWTALGLHAAIQSPAGRFYVAPYRQGDLSHYIAYDARDAAPAGFEEVDDVQDALPRAPLGSDQLTSRSHAQRHTYRLAVATTGEFSLAHGGTVTDTLAAIVATVNEVNGLYEADLSIRFILIANEEAIIYLDGATDPYTNEDAYMMLGENQANLDAVIGSANYDVGHVFRSGSSGVAMVGTPCIEYAKAQGVSSGSASMMAHEVGHQFGSGHTQNPYGDECGRVASQAYEPGSGSTIMSYAGRCDQSILDSGEGRSFYFHTSSFDRAIDYITLYDGASCGTVTDPGNVAPQVEAGADHTIPRGTPFSLAGSGSDADGDALTYCWEELDLGPAPFTMTLPNTDADGNARPIFRSFPPTGSPTRIFPRLVSILDGSDAGRGESLPTIARTMAFRLTARDGRGGVAYDTATVAVAGSAGPFRVTEPAGVVFWPRGSQQAVLWDVANTTAAPVSCSTANILLSIDGGNTFSYTLAAGTPNDGSQVVTVPDLDPVGLVIKVECANNIFFDLSQGATVCTPLFHDDHEQGFDGWTITDGYHYTNTWQTRTDGGFSGDNYFYVSDVNHWYADSYLDSPSIVVAGSPLALSFLHRYDLETTWSGDWASNAGVVEIRINGGAWTDVGRDNFIQNAYNMVVTTTKSSPILGRWAFSGDSRGYVQSLVDLSSLVSDGDTVQVRFRMAEDGWNGSYEGKGWLVDDVSVCRGDPIPVLSMAKSVQAAGLPIEPGDALTYTLVVANSGGADATGVHVTDTLPAEVSGADLDQYIDVAAGSSVTLHIPVTVSLSAVRGQVIENTAYYVYSPTLACAPAPACTGSGSVTFAVGSQVYLPVVFRH